MHPIAIEETNKTTRWPTCVPNFLVGVTEVNAWHAAVRLFGYKEYSQIEFRRLLSRELINNPYLPPREEERRTTPRKRPPQQQHGLEALPRGKTMKQGRIVPAKSDYPQVKCSGCTRKVRTYCLCLPGCMLCTNCWVQHVLASVLTE